MASSSAVASAPAKRASSRVRKQPDHFTSSPFSSGKRKRTDNDEGDEDGNGDVHMEDEEEDDSDSEDPEDDEPAEEEIRENAQAKKARKPKSAAPKKPAQKKPKVNGVSLPIRGATKAATKKRFARNAKIVNTADAEAAGGLYAAVFASGKEVELLVKEWLEAFEEDQLPALADFVNFVLKSAGCEGMVTQHDIGNPDGAHARLADLQQEYQATQPTDYPMIAKGKSAGAFKSTVWTFISTMIKSIGANGTLSSEATLLENIYLWLSTMSAAGNRSFRHTSTVCSLSVMTALTEVAGEYATKVADSQRHAELERKKAKPNKQRVKQIEQKSKDASADLELVSAQLTDWFEACFIHRYRDVNPLIRKECVEALGDWIMILPDKFFDAQHLRYMGFVLSDEAAAIRQEAVKQLNRLYDDSSKLGGLKTFTERFRARIVEIGTSDADINVRVSGLELLDVLRENDLLEPDDIDSIGRLIFHDDVKVRKAVAGFFSASVRELFNMKVDDLGGTDSLEEALPDASDMNFEAPRLEWLSYKSLATTLQAYDQDDSMPSQIERSKTDGSFVLHAAGVGSRLNVAVDVLYDKIDAIREWQALAGYLLFEHSSGRSNGVEEDTLSQLKHESILSDAEELILLEVLNTAVKRSLCDMGEKVTSTKSKLSKTQKEDIREEQEETVRNLTELIPRLLKKYGDVPRTAGAVLRLEAVLALPTLQGLRQDSSASAALLDDLRKQFMSHSTDDVLAPATAAILHAQTYSELDETSMEKLSSLWEDVVSNLAELLDVAMITVRGASQLDELLAASNNLLRLVRLAAVSNCIAPLEDKSVAANNESTGREYHGAIDFIIDLVLRATHSSGPSLDPEEAALEDLVAARAAEAALFYFRWKFLSIVTAIKTGSNADVGFEVLEALAERRDTYVGNLVRVLDSRRASDQICVSVASNLLELFISAAILRTEKAKPGMSDDYTVLIMGLDETHEKLVMKVFAAAEKEYARLSGKKLDEHIAEDPEVEEEEDVDADPLDDDDPLSDDDEADKEAQQQSQTLASQQLRDAKQLKPVIAEERLCQLTTKLLHAIIAGVIDDKAIRKRLERNKTRLGANYKEVLAYLDVSKKQGKGKAKAKPKAKATAATAAAAANTSKASKSFKSNAIVAEDEMEDDIVDDDVELDVEDEPRPQEDEEMANGDADDDPESVAGD